MAEKKDFFIVRPGPADLPILAVFILGLSSAFFSNRSSLNMALIMLVAAMVLYYISGIFIKSRNGYASGFTRALDSFIIGLVFLASPCIFMYHWQYNGVLETIVLTVFMISGILRIAFFGDSGEGRECSRYDRIGMPVFWSPVIPAAAYLAANYVSRAIINIALSIMFLLFSSLMLLNTEIKFLYIPLISPSKKTHKK